VPLRGTDLKVQHTGGRSFMVSIPEEMLRSYIVEHYPGETLVAFVADLPERTLGREIAKILVLGSLADIGRAKYHFGLTSNRLIVLNHSTQEAQVYDWPVFKSTRYMPPRHDRDGKPVESELWIRYAGSTAPKPPARLFSVPEKRRQTICQFVAQMFQLQASRFVEEATRQSGHTGHITHLARLGQGVPARICYSPDGLFFAIGTSNGVYLYESQTQNIIRFYPSARGVYCVTFSPDGRLLAYADQAIYVWDLRSDQLITTLGHAGSILGLSFSRDGRFLASSGWDAIAQIWEVATWKLVQIVEEKAQGVGSILLTPDGCRFVYIQSVWAPPWVHNTVYVRDIFSGKQVGSPPVKCCWLENLPESFQAR
jgi:WD40 repeat protein